MHCCAIPFLCSLAAGWYRLCDGGIKTVEIGENTTLTLYMRYTSLQRLLVTSYDLAHTSGRCKPDCIPCSYQ